MALSHLTDSEIALRLANAIRAWRQSPEGAGMTQAALAEKSGVATTSLKRFEKTGALTLRSLIAIMRALGLVDRLEDLVPQPDSPGPLAMLQAERTRKQRRRAPRRPGLAAKRTDTATHG
jgi:transcriptional regulator with XRE-family HTH domain